METATITDNDKNKNKNDNTDEDDGNGDDNNNSAQRAVVIRRQIDPKRLNAGLSLQIAQILHQKSLQKQQAQQQKEEVQQTLKTQSEQNDKPETSTNVSRIALPAVNISSDGDAIPAASKLQKSTALPSASKILSVPKITITSPPCDNVIETLRENRCERLEDVKRILNRQILMRKLTNNAANTIAVPLSSHREQPKTPTMLQLPPQTIIKSIRKSEPPVNTTIQSTTTTNPSPLITVRKFHTIASPDMAVKATATSTLPTQTSQQQSHIILTTMPGGTTIRPLMISTTTGQTSTQNTQSIPLTRPITLAGLTELKTVVGSQPDHGHGTNIFAATHFRPFPVQIQSQSQQQRPEFLTTKAKIRPIMISRDAIRMQTPQFVTVRPIAALSKSAVLSLSSPNVSQASNSTLSEQKTPVSLSIQQKQLPNSSANATCNDMSLNRNSTSATATGNARSKIISTITTPKPKIFEIHTTKQLEQTVPDQLKVKRPNIMKASLDSKIQPFAASKKNRTSLGTIVGTPESTTKIVSTVVGSKSDSVKSDSILASLEQTARSVQKQHPSESRLLSKTENVPIVLENKLLKPGEQIDLKGLRLPCRNIDEVLPKSDAKQKVQAAIGNEKTKATRKMHVIISNEKLKSAKVDMAELAKKVLQRATKSPATAVEKPDLTVLKPLTDKVPKCTASVESNEQKTPQLRLSAKSIDVVMQKSTIPKASLALNKKAPSSLDTQKVLLREKVLALCSLKGVEHSSPVKEYPKTIEIVDDEDNTDDDISGPTAVDFIASLAMVNCSNSKTTAEVDHGEKPIVKSTPNELDGETNVITKESNVCGTQLETTSEAPMEKKCTEEAKIAETTFNVSLDESVKEATANSGEKSNALVVKALIFDNPVEQATISDNSTNETVRTQKKTNIGSPQKLSCAGIIGIALEVEREQEVITADEKVDQQVSASTDQDSEEQIKAVPKESADSGRLAEEEAEIEKNSEPLMLKSYTSPGDKRTAEEKERSSSEISTKVDTTDVKDSIKVAEANKSYSPKNDISQALKMDKDKSESSSSPEHRNTSTATQSTSSTVNTTTKTTRKRIGIRNAPINLVARKKPAVKKPAHISDANAIQKADDNACTPPATNEFVKELEEPPKKVTTIVANDLVSLSMRESTKKSVAEKQDDEKTVADIIASEMAVDKSIIPVSSKKLSEEITNKENETKLQKKGDSNEDALPTFDGDFQTVDKQVNIPLTSNALVEKPIQTFEEHACQKQLNNDSVTTVDTCVPQKADDGVMNSLLKSTEFLEKQKEIVDEKTPKKPFDNESALKEPPNETGLNIGTCVLKKAVDIVNTSLNKKELAANRTETGLGTCSFNEPFTNVEEQTLKNSLDKEEPSSFEHCGAQEGIVPKSNMECMQGVKEKITIIEEPKKRSPKKQAESVSLALSELPVITGSVDETALQVIPQHSRETIEHLTPSKGQGYINEKSKNSSSDDAVEGQNKNYENDSMDFDELKSMSPVKAGKDQQVITNDIVISLNLESDKEEREQNDSTTQNQAKQQYEEHGIQVLATVAITAENMKLLNAEEETLSAVQKQTSLPEVGTIIDMKAYGLEKSSAEIIVQQVVLDNVDNTQRVEEDENTQKTEKTVIQNDVFEAKTADRSKNSAKMENIVTKSRNFIFDDSDSQSCHADMIDNSDIESTAQQIINRRRLRRKRPISALLSSSGSEDEANKDNNRSLSRSGRKSVVKSFNECSNASDSSELLGFPVQSAVINAIDAESLKLDNKSPNTISTMEPSFDALSSQSSSKKFDSIYASPFVAVDSRRNIPLKKRWELTQQPSHDETDITDDTSPAADDDTMDDEETGSNFITQEVKPTFGDLKSISKAESFSVFKSTSQEKESETLDNEAVTHITEQKFDEVKSIRCSENSDTENNAMRQVETLNAQNIKPFPKDIISDCISKSLKNSNYLVTQEEDHKASGTRKRSRKMNSSITESNTGESEEEEQKVIQVVSDTAQISSTPLPRKRGRPPKKVQKSDNAALTKLELDEPVCITATSTPVVTAQKKRGRRPGLSTLATETSDNLSLESVSQVETEQSETVEIDMSQIDATEVALPVPKKRGRKPKQKVGKSEVSPQMETSMLEEQSHAIEIAAEDTKEVNIPVKKKRGRKPRAIVDSISEDTSQNTLEDTRHSSLFFGESQTETTHETIDEKDNLEIPAKKKRGRKPREKTDQTEELQKLEDSISEETTTSLTSSHAGKQRDRKPRSIIENETQESIPSLEMTLEKLDDASQSKTPRFGGKRRKPETVNDFNPRLLLIRRRDQLDTEEILTVAESEAGQGPLKCGLCLARTTAGSWYKHQGEHYGVGWIVDKEPAVNVTSRSNVLSRMHAYFKLKETSLLCRLCLRSYRSPLGLLLHLEGCGNVQRIECPTCGHQYTKLSYVGHQRTCRGVDSVSEEPKNESLDSTVLSNSGRFKRASQIKAENKLKNLSKVLSESDVHFEPKDFIKKRKEKKNEVFYCTVCKRSDTSFSTEAEAINHVVQKHKDNEEKPDNDFEGDSSDFDENAEQEQESDESSTGSNTDGSESDSEFAAKSVTEKKKPRNRKKIKVWDAKRMGGLPPVYSQRCNDVPKMVLDKWKQFIGSNYAHKTLYPYAITIYGGETKRAKELLSAKIDSMKFTFSQSCKPFKELGTPENLEWQQLQRFESFDQRTIDKLIYLGSPIKTLAWAPLPETVSEQYFVVGCRKSLASFTRLCGPKSEDSLLFVYKISTTKTDQNAAKKGFQAKIHFALCIQNGPVHTLAFLPSGGYDQAANRLGLLAVGATSSDIKIYALPIDPAQCEEVKIANGEVVRVISLKPALELTLDASADRQLSNHSLIATQCVHICWSEFLGHQHIFASYANGFISIWDINEPSNPIYNLNCHFREGRRCFTPLQYFYFGEKLNKPFAIHYDSNGPRWLAVQGCARKLVVYDVRSLSHPVPIKEEFLRNIARDIDWSPLWEAFTTAFCDSIPNSGRCVLAYNPASVSFTHSRMEYMLCGVSTLHYNPWQSVYGIGVDNGDIIYMNAREMNQDLQVLIRPKRNVMALSVLDIKRLDGEELIRPKSCDKSCNWQMHEKDYKEKYGLVFAQMSKLTSDDRKAYLSDKRIPPPYVERYMRISILRWNLNDCPKRYLAVGYENGFLRLMRFKRENYFE